MKSALAASLVSHGRLYGRLWRGFGQTASSSPAVAPGAMSSAGPTGRSSASYRWARSPIFSGATSSGIDLEGAAAGWAARRRDDDDLPKIERAFRELEKAYSDNQPGVEADLTFHLAVARASHNLFFVSTLESLRQQIAFGVELSRSLTMLDTPQRQDRVLAEHRTVIEAIRVRDPKSAEAAMRAHITSAKNRMFVGHD